MAYSVGSVLFTFAGRSVGTGLLNRVRLALALVLTMLLHLTLVGSLFPVNTPLDKVAWLAGSGLVGYIFGDALLFQGFVLVGPRLSMLVYSLAPVLGTVMAWVFLHERLSFIEIIGIVITMAGIAIVVSKPPETPQGETLQKDRRQYVSGLLFALGGAVGQAGGSLLAKIGLTGGMPAISGNAIRLAAAVILVWVLALFQGQIVSSFQTMRRQRRIQVYVLIASIAGPVVGVWLALTSLQLAPLGIVTTLQSLAPIFLIPIGFFVFKERITRRIVLGTLIAIVGSVLLFF
jgi:drug/metabolite transporter (DMT)-like permease